MSSSRFSIDSSSMQSLYSAPRPAPRPYDAPCPQGVYPSPPPDFLVLPIIPPTDCRIFLSADDHSNTILPRVSIGSIGADHDMAIELCRTQVEGEQRCANCAEMDISCQFWEAGIPCPTCTILGIPDCANASAARFIDVLVRARDRYMLHERDILSALVRDGLMTPTKFEREYADTEHNYYAVVQGALSRFSINSSATKNLAFQGYRDLANSSQDAALLSRFITLGTEAHIHPSILLSERVEMRVKILIRIDYTSPPLLAATMMPNLAEPTMLSGSRNNMPSVTPPCLDKSQEDSVRTLFKSVRATKYEDPADQDAFLLAAARSVLHFRPQVASFAASSDIGECVFAIRTALVSNNIRLTTTPDPIISSISDFAGEIVRLRQTVRDRKRAQSEQLRAEEGVAARTARREALESAAKRELNKSDPDVVSIPSDDDPIAPHPSPLRVKSYTKSLQEESPSPSMPVCPTELLSPLLELEGMMYSLQMSSPRVLLASPSLPSQSLQAPVQIAKRPHHVHHANECVLRAPVTNGLPFNRGRSPTQKPLNLPLPTPAATPTKLSNVAVLVPRPLNRAHRPKYSYVDDWLASRQNFTANPVPRNTFFGDFSPSRNQLPRVKAKKVKRCFFCNAASHLCANCPLREID
ncbi:hypothetical protein B0H16DRAFT_1471945 [Mycena metata]|uniref:Uncharacterized protein n=1 Tax=Mycena metata TaxID=1033252 RepID=A0AAD7HPG2_9AGAR|nr:hypothetical protein B0H16DRAFT_1471945 [Mycena metata]